MSTTLTVFARIENVERVISCLCQVNNKGNQSGGQSGLCFFSHVLYNYVSL